LKGKAVPGMLDIPSVKQQQQKGQQDTAASEDKEDLLPAPEALTAQDQ
jgi:hypothetical protein